MKKITLKWSQNRKAPNKAIDLLRRELADFCQLFNAAPFEVHASGIDDQKSYVVNVVNDTIQKIERYSRIKKGALRMSVSRPNEGLKESYIWLIWGTDNGGCNLATIVMKVKEEESEPKKIDVFVGPPESGKTRCAKDRYPHYPSGVFIDGRNLVCRGRVSSNFLEDVTDKTDAIIIDDVPLDQLEYVVSMFYVETLVISRQARWRIYLPRPNIIVICETTVDALPIGHSFNQRTNVTSFPLKGGDEL